MKVAKRFTVYVLSDGTKLRIPCPVRGRPRTDPRYRHSDPRWRREGNRMKVYLCGGINGLSDQECRDWREAAKARLSYHGIETLDPMRRDYRGREDESVNLIVQGDLEDIAVCDVVLVNATRPSWGTAMEIVYACQASKSIVAFKETGPVSPWLRFHCHFIETVFEEALRRVLELCAA